MSTKNGKMSNNMINKNKKIILTGDRPTGKLHLGHYFGSLVNRINLQNTKNHLNNDMEYQQFIMIADMQALTDNAENSQKITNSVQELILDYYSVGLISLDEATPQSTIFLQSAVPALSELTMYYMNLVTESRVVRNPTVKTEREQKKWQGGSVPFGFLAYPVSQAADITAFKADLVPVGEDQLPMIELTNEIVDKFNSTYTNVLKRTKALITKDSKLSRLIGVDGEQKMSKSLNNAIFLSDSEDELRAKIKKMRTCTRTTLSDPGTLEGNAVFYFIDVMSSWFNMNNSYHPILQEIPIWKARYISGGNDNEEYAKDSFLKEQLFNLINQMLIPIRQKRQEGIENIGLIYKKIDSDIKKANIIANHTLHELKCAMGLNYPNF
jgi:tryptophanyl-tRNA synthetase